ncbi:flagellar hook-length control protein FliK, partial [Bordetella pertussis]|uniref:flagellar hook-length control protein FliK n=1 Tax=Bordetella pertussis TaxID=520 RepID=UPI000A7AE6FF
EPAPASQPAGHAPGAPVPGIHQDATLLVRTHWATRLKLNLPRLGTVEARLNLAANQLVLHVVAPDSAAEIGAAADALRQQLSAAGLTLTNLSVDAVAAPGFALPEA